MARGLIDNDSAYRWVSANALELRLSCTNHRYQVLHVLVFPLQGRVYDVLREVLDAACRQPPPKGIAQSPQSRAMYGVDIMFKWDMDEKGEMDLFWTRFCVSRVQCKTVVINTFRPRQNGRQFPYDIFKCIFLNENVRIAMKIPLKFVLKGPINDIPALVQVRRQAITWTNAG